MQGDPGSNLDIVILGLLLLSLVQEVLELHHTWHEVTVVSLILEQEQLLHRDEDELLVFVELLEVLGIVNQLIGRFDEATEPFRSLSGISDQVVAGEEGEDA